MSSAPITRKQGLDALHQQALALLFSFAKSTRDAARYDWTGYPRIRRVTDVTNILKRDLSELHRRLDGIKAGHQRTISSAVLNNPNHPALLQAGGDYHNFIDDATSVLNPHAGELMDMLHELAQLEKQSA